MASMTPRTQPDRSRYRMRSPTWSTLVAPLPRTDSARGGWASLPPSTPASSCNSRQFSSRSCWAPSSTSLGLPCLSKCLANRPSLRAKSMKSTCSPVFGLVHQSSVTAGLPCSDRRCANRIAVARIVDQQGERARVDGQSSLVGRHIVGHAVFGLTGRVAADRRPGRRIPGLPARCDRSGWHGRTSFERRRCGDASWRSEQFPCVVPVCPGSPCRARSSWHSGR